MDLVQTIGAAVALGAATGLKDSAAQAVKDAYAGVRQMLQRDLPAVVPSVEQLEKAPAG